ncbi:Uncharacterised protein [Serratia fonticola]|uniref:Cupin fold metalloprotein WbuC cupin domain-containing protein n=1 Tax=Serratia fonticola TaxID=47917 RepID=A0A4U9VRN8_SERFO|nr:Uncharacterised protein [Serratia fonticola]
MKQITAHDLTTMSEQAATLPRLRAHRTLHEELSDPVQRLAIAMEPGTYIRPHRHPQTWELLTPLRGRFVVLQFNDEGVVTQRTLLGEETKVLEMPAFTWHAVLSVDPGGVVFEVKQGPYQAARRRRLYALGSTRRWRGDRSGDALVCHCQSGRSFRTLTPSP